jgi:hypothetical protein
MIPQKSYKFTHEFVKNVLREQEPILESLQKDSNYAELAKVQFVNFLFKIKETKKRFDESINLTIFKNLLKGFQ